MAGRPIYLDHNATTPVHPTVRAAMVPWLGDRFGNPSSPHAYGREAAEAVTLARAQVAGLIGAQPDEIHFTGGGTEADNLAVFGPRPAVRRIVVSAVEHPAIEAPSRVLESQGFVRAQLPVAATGRVDLAAATEILATPAGILSVILAQNETGVIQPVAHLSKLCRAASPDAVVHTDAAQAVGKIPVDVGALGVDLLTVVSHKLYGPGGIGALWVRRGVILEPRLHGGGQERGLRPGTEPVALVVGLGAACAMAAADLEREAARQQALREALWDRLRSAVPSLRRTGQQVETLPNTLHVRFVGVSGAALLERAPSVATATGSACHSHDETPSGVLGAMGLDAADAMGAVRISLGRSTTDADIERAAAALADAHRGLAP